MRRLNPLSTRRRVWLAPLLCTAASLACAGSMLAQTNLVPNGNLDTWPTATGTPPVGNPTNWNGAGSAIRAPGLLTGSTYSGVIQGGNFGLAPLSLSANPTQFALGFVLAAGDPGSTTARTFNLQVTQVGGSNPTIGLRAVEGSSGAGFISFQAFNVTTGTWVPLSSTLGQNLSASTYNSTSNTFTTLNAYNIEVDGNFNGASPSYSFSYGPVGSSMTTISGLTYFQTTPNGGAVSGFTFAGSSSATGTYYGVDNVFLYAVPEPNTAWLAAAGVCAVFVTWRGRKTLRRA